MESVWLKAYWSCKLSIFDTDEFLISSDIFLHWVLYFGPTTRRQIKTKRQYKSIFSGLEDLMMWAILRSKTLQ